MARSLLAIILVGLLHVGSASTQNASPLGGVWALNRPSSELPRDIGFNPAWMTAQGQGDQGAASSGNSGGRGRRGSSSSSGSSGGASPFSGHQESYEDAQRVKLLTAEARNPPSRLIIVDAPTAVTFTNELGQSRTLHPDGKEESIELEGVPFRVTSNRAGSQLTVVYRVDQDRDVRYVYSAEMNPTRLVVDVQFLERGNGDKARLVFDPGLATENLHAAADGHAAGSSSQPAAAAFDQRPGAELKGLTTLGILVENLSAQAAACGLNQDAIESALSKRLTSSGGLTVRRNSDDDTYVYVNIQTTMLPGGLCVSRYDAFLYTHGTANLSYRQQPVLVQVSLMHRGGIDVSAPPTHGPGVTRGLEGYIDVFATQIRDANK
jgi:hypothetical protein